VPAWVTTYALAAAAPKKIHRMVKEKKVGRGYPRPKKKSLGKSRSFPFRDPPGTLATGYYLQDTGYKQSRERSCRRQRAGFLGDCTANPVQVLFVLIYDIIA
jgi:hypothetical protein